MTHRGHASGDAMTTWLVDAFNVLGSRPDGWWRDRTGALVALVAQVVAWRPADEAVEVVVDGRARTALPAGHHTGLTVRYAGRSDPDAADDVIVALVEAAPDPAALRVVTSDARLRARVEALGARVEGAGVFRDRLDRVV